MSDPLYNLDVTLAPELVNLKAILGVDAASIIRDLAGIAQGEDWGAPSSGAQLSLVFRSSRLEAVTGAVDLLPAVALDRVKKWRLETVAAIRAERLLIGPMGLRLDEKTMTRIDQAYSYLKEDADVASVRWEVSRNEWRPMPREMFVGTQGLIVQIGRYTQAVFGRSEVIMSQVAQAETIAEVMEVTIGGWPSWS